MYRTTKEDFNKTLKGLLKPISVFLIVANKEVSLVEDISNFLPVIFLFCVPEFDTFRVPNA